MGFKVFTGRKFNGDFDNFQELLFSLKQNKNLIELLKIKTDKIIDLDQIDLKDGLIKHSNKDTFAPKVLTDKFSKFVCDNIDDYKFKFYDNILHEETWCWQNRYNKININILFKVIDKEIYIIIDTFDRDLVDLISKELKLENFEYWDHVDKPIDIEEKIWTKRKQIWQKWCLNNCNFSYEVFKFSKHFYLLNLIKKIIN